MSEQGFVGRVIGAASQGPFGAVVAALLSAVTEPLVNSMLVKRTPLVEALKEFDPMKIQNFLKTRLATNFIKFPFFESANIVMQGVDLPPTARGAALGYIFCTTLPIMNYFQKSMNLPTPQNLQGYGPTVLRDIIYGIARNKVSTFLASLNPTFATTTMGRLVNRFATVVAACVLSAPGNDLPSYCLQRPNCKHGLVDFFNDFFQPANFIRSASVGALIMGICLAIRTVAMPKNRLAMMNLFVHKNPCGFVLIILLVLQHMKAPSSARNGPDPVYHAKKCSALQDITLWRSELGYNRVQYSLWYVRCSKWMV